MKNHRLMPFQGVIRSLLTCEDSKKTIASSPVDKVLASFAGFPHDSHSGLTRKACSRFTYLYETGTEIKNSRQISIVSVEELQEIADGMAIDHVSPGWLGANIELQGIPRLTLLPPSTRLVFSSRATLVVDLENRPCAHPARIIDQYFPGKGRKFVKQALHRRGVTAWVEREGELQTGDSVQVFFPDQPAHPSQHEL